MDHLDKESAPNFPTDHIQEILNLYIDK